MKEISLNNVIPFVFRNRDLTHSEIWNSEVSFSKGNNYLIEAESGKGKSTFVSYLLGYRNDYEGDISFDGVDIKKYKIRDWIDIRKRTMSCLFQEMNLFLELTALENVLLKNNLSSFKSEQEIKDLFERLGIADKMNTEIRKISFGQQQRVAMIRAIVQPFDFILMDEPVSHLDENNSNILGEIALEEAERQGAGIIVTSIGKHPNLNYNIKFKL